MTARFLSPFPADGKWVPQLVSDVPPAGERVNGDSIVAKVIDDLADSRLSARDILATITRTLSRHRPGTWVAALMTRDPRTSVVVAADDPEPAFGQYVERYMTTIYGSNLGPTSGLVKEVIESGTPLLRPNLSFEQFLAMLSPVSRAYIGENPLPVEVTSLGLLIVPMRARGATIGAISVFDHDGAQPFTQEDSLWLQSVADRTGVVIENGQLYEDAIKRLERLVSLQSVVRAIAASSDLRFTLKVILDQVKSRLEVDAADVLLSDDRDGMLGIVASTGFLSTSMPGYRIPPDESLPGPAVNSRRIEVLNTLDNGAHARRRSLFAREGFKAYAAVPLIAAGELVGVLEIFHRTALNLDDESLSYLDTIGSSAAIAIDSAVLRERLMAAGPAHRPGPAVRAPEMSRVEGQILGMLVEGLTNREIAARIHLSQNTVKFHVRRLLDKAKTSNRTELTRKATQEGWL
jgi:GAF domain-containing protein